MSSFFMYVDPLPPRKTRLIELTEGAPVLSQTPSYVRKKNFQPLAF